MIANLTAWRTTDRDWNNIIYVLVTLGFDISGFTEVQDPRIDGSIDITNTTDIPSDIFDLMEQSKYPNIYNFQGLVQESYSWGPDYILNGNNISNLNNIVSKIGGSVTYEIETVDSITHEMTHLLQMRALDRMLQTEPSKSIYFDYMKSLPLYLTNTGNYSLPSTKP